MSFFLSPENSLKETTFFSAMPTHLSNAKQKRHKLFYEVLEHVCNITVIDGRFGEKTYYTKCKKCKTETKDKKHEEKETDVALGIKIVSDILTKDVDKVILVSADTDFIPVVDYILRNTEKHIKVLIPFNASYSEPYDIKNNKHYLSRTEKKIWNKVDKKTPHSPL